VRPLHSLALLLMVLGFAAPAAARVPRVVFVDKFGYQS
jgi:hypothetical protein